MLKAIKSALEEAQTSDQVSDQVNDQVKLLLAVLSTKELKATELMNALGLAHRPSFRKNYLNPALEKGLIERTHPDKKNSPQQRYRLKT